MLSFPTLFFLRDSIDDSPRATIASRSAFHIGSISVSNGRTDWHSFASKEMDMLKLPKLLVLAAIAMLIFPVCSPIKSGTTKSDSLPNLVQLRSQKQKSRTSICTYCHDSQNHTELARKPMSH